MASYRLNRRIADLVVTHGSDLSTAQNANRETIGRPKDAVLQDVRQHYRSDPKNEKLSTEFGNILSIQIPYDADLPDIFQ